MDFGVLGTVEARKDGVSVSVGGPKQRALLAMLLLARNEAVSKDRLIDALWGENSPATAAHTLDAYVSRLRKLVGVERLTRSAGGYVLHVEPDELDLDRFERLAAEGRAHLAARRADEAAHSLRSALEVWRGPAVADLVYEPFGARAADALEGSRLAAIEDRIEADLASGGSADLVAELEALVAEHPFRERLTAQLMLVLYRSGQQARALDIYRAGRQRLAEDLGLEPGLPLRELERAILKQDPALAPARVRPLPLFARRPRHRLAVIPLAVGAAVCVGVVLLFVFRGSSASGLPSSSNGIVRIGAGTPRSVPLPGSAAALALGYGALWAAEPGEGAVAQIDPERQVVVDRIPVGGAPAELAVGGGSIWTADVAGDRVTRIDPGTGTLTGRVGLGGGSVSALAFGRGSLWVADGTDDSLLEIDPTTGVVRRTVTLAVAPSAIAVTEHAVWVADYEDGTVSEVDPRGGSVLATARVGTGPAALTVTPGAVWVVNALDSTVSRIDTDTATVSTTIPVKSGPTALAASGQSVWVVSEYDDSVSRIDARRSVVVRTTAVGESPTAVAVAGARVWIGTQSLAAHHGGTVTILHTRPITVDPALQTDVLPLVSDALTRDELVTYDHAPGSAGTRLVPDLAENVPIPTGAGTTYTFRLRPGIRYSDGRLVRAADYRRAIERAFRVHSIVRDEFTGIVGASDCTPRRCDLTRGIVTDETARTVTIHLRAPNPDFLANLTSAAASPVPPGTPWQRVSQPIPGTGPYLIAEANARRIVWLRSPRFHEWSHAAQPAGNPDRIVLRFGLSPARETHEVESGHADVFVDNIPRRLLASVQTRYAAHVHGYVIPATDFFQFNTTLPPFNDVRVRRALNFAIDRRTIVQLYGGVALAESTCQVLPPGDSGYRRYCPYTLDPHRDGAYRGPDLARARRLVSASGTRGERVTVWGWTDDPTISESVVRYVGGELRALGYHVRFRFVSHALLLNPPRSVFRSIQLIATGWGDPSYGFFATYFACGGTNAHGWFCDPAIDRLNAQARALEATSPHQAAALWERIDHSLADQAAAAPMINERGLAFVSARVANYESHPYWGLIADQLSVNR